MLILNVKFAILVPFVDCSEIHNPTVVLIFKITFSLFFSFSLY